MPQVVDFSNSFLSFRIDLDKKPPGTLSHQPPYALNTARIAPECCLTLRSGASAATKRFVLGASCKTEVVGADKDLFLLPNADFAPIFTDEEYLLIKTYAQAGTQVPLAPPFTGEQPDRQWGRHADTYDDWSLDVRQRDAELLTTPQQIVEATLSGHALVARTTITQGDLTASIEYPIKTMNANERDWVYQTDTGPVLFPNLSVAWDEMIHTMELAYAAFNCPEWTQFVVRRPTPINDDVSVYHYSESERLDATNEVFRLA